MYLAKEKFPDQILVLDLNTFLILTIGWLWFKIYVNLCVEYNCWRI